LHNHEDLYDQNSRRSGMTAAGSGEESPHAESVRWFILRPEQPVSVRVVDAAALERATVAEAVFGNRPDGPGQLVLSVVRGWGPMPRLDLFWDGTGPDGHGYRWSVTDSGSLQVTANVETVIEYGPGSWHEWQP
jgi:hypothetical protein